MAHTPDSNGPRDFAGREATPGEETEMIERDPAERAVTPGQMDAIAESGDVDPLLRPAGEEGPPSARGDTGDPQFPHTHGKREDTDAGNAAAAGDAEEDRIRPGDRKRGRE